MPPSSPIIQQPFPYRLASIRGVTRGRNGAAFRAGIRHGRVVERKISQLPRQSRHRRRARSSHHLLTLSLLQLTVQLGVFAGIGADAPEIGVLCFRFELKTGGDFGRSLLELASFGLFFRLLLLQILFEFL